MDSLTSGLKGVTDGVGSAVSGIGRGVSGSGVKESEQDASRKPKSPEGSNTNAEAASPGGGLLGGISGVLGDITSGITSGLLAPTADAATLLGSAAGAGLKIGRDVASAGLDTGTDVLGRGANLAGTALGGVVDAAASASGAVFAPVGSGLAALGGLEQLGEEGLKAINGLSLGAVREVGALTTRALNMSGKTPTFFDPDADGVVSMTDTTRGLVLLGLDEKTAGYAAYALHSVFAYPTSESWIPNTTTIHVARMGRTKWGRNWGSFERSEWIDDIVDIDEFFAPKKDEKQWADYWKQGRQYFGILLLIFEWGTTWPFYIPPVPVPEIPFSDEIGKVVRKVILPTILSNMKKAREADPDKKNKPRSEKPSDKPPKDPKEA